MFLLVSVGVYAADYEIMVTRDGKILRVRVSSITNGQITYSNLNERQYGISTSPTDYVFMILREKGESWFFDEQGNQKSIESPRCRINQDNLIFLNNGTVFVAYNLKMSADAVSFQRMDNQKAAYYHTPKKDLFLLKDENNKITLFNEEYIRKHPHPVPSPTDSPSAAENNSNLSAQPVASANNRQSGASSPQPTNPSDRPLLAVESIHGAISTIPFKPAPDMSPADLERRVNGINPYTLYRKGSVAEYKFQQNGKDFAYMGGPTYIQQVVSDERIENGLLVSYVSQRFFNKKHQPSKGVPAKYLGYLFPTEIDVNGNFHLTHDISEDCGYYIKKRQGYAILIPGHMEVGQRLPCSAIYDMLSGRLGGNWKSTRTYKDFVVEKEEQAITPAGTFDCMKLVGKMEVQGSLGEYTVRYDLWLARGIGVVRLDVTTILKDGNDGSKYTIYLNALTLT